MSFADTYREIVVPDLRRRCRAQAGSVALDLTSFSEAQSNVIHAAYARGSGNLPNEIQIDLMNWIGSTLLRDIDAAERDVAKYRVMSDRVAAENDRYFAAFAAHQAAVTLAW